MSGSWTDRFTTSQPRSTATPRYEDGMKDKVVAPADTSFGLSKDEATSEGINTYTRPKASYTAK